MLAKLVLATALLGASAVLSPAFAADFRLSADNLVQGKFSNSHLNGEAYGFGCDGENLSPRFTWSGAPSGTKSFALTIYDRDAPTGIGWFHWVVVNIPASTTTLAPGVQPDGHALPSPALQTRTDFGVSGYAGACPPAGAVHNYIVTLTALKVETIPDNANATPALVGFHIHANALADARLEIAQSR
ncbi:YbhB/YbcL family Raf kinase inhibitor-like protein [Agrobacterium vitis]|uniref:YbhB/YbcL family Raf kinase inhibitor-like protein n=1 Tax=Agrobacterium vitis TaxID=373 RepID=UPI0012E75277|nr:YbhB/YbcL family Raf kinase inhibitor-like protein [Agrobacterium vitis]MUZ65646.1 YbhB/YbcL family Raf kinase inhibitor-like protein [Agrobacterium vitis]